MLIHFYLTLIISVLVSVNAQSPPDPKQANLKNHKFSPCQTCKILVNSFQAGIERTSRGKLEGGDAAWEEERQGSYATSEVRFVEIQEKLCSEVDKGQFQCQGLAEESEAYFEEWWENQTAFKDLHTFLCIEKLAVCCPEFHYGPNCLPCNGFPNNVCGGNGKCKGSGTRKGNGECSCNIGYEGDQCNNCSPSYYISYKDESKLLCSPCHLSCLNTCTQAGPKGCLSCKPGWHMDTEQGCTDINECIAMSSPCNPHQFCVNNEGSFSCLECDKACRRCDGDGPDMCLECADDYQMKGNICESDDKQDRERTLNITRYITYFGLCVATCIIFQRNVYAASFIGLLVALYISISEYTLATGKASSEPFFDLGGVLKSF